VIALSEGRCTAWFAKNTRTRAERRRLNTCAAFSRGTSNCCSSTPQMRRQEASAARRSVQLARPIFQCLIAQ
jgi:hypothetical protein